MRTYLLSTGLAVAGLLAGGLLLIRAGWVGGSKEVVLVAAGINFVASWAAVVPLILLRNLGRDYIPQAVFGAMAARMLIAAFAMLAALLAGPWPTLALSSWIAVFYLTLLIVETAWAVRMVQRCYRRGETQTS